MPTFSGRNCANAPQVGDVDRAQVALFMQGCVTDGWKRVAVVEHMQILAAYNGGKVWIHPELWSQN